MQQFDLRDFIKIKRLELGLSLNKFAINCELESSTISRIENKKYDLKYPVLEKISKSFGLSPAQFLTEYENYCKNLEK